MLKLEVLILRNKIRLEKMIENDENKSKILAQSKRLDKYITEKQKIMNQINL